MSYAGLVLLLGGAVMLFGDYTWNPNARSIAHPIMIAVGALVLVRVWFLKRRGRG